MDQHQLAWLLARLGTATAISDLEGRHARLQDTRAVALEVLNERRAALITDPLRVTVQGITLDTTENLRALERLLADVTTERSPDGPDTAAPHILTITPLRPANRRR
ncbi:hypothetical protein [Embleya sp. NPDC059237]|uniref:hypothetical protein n=1 Tax=Embleya sp. NPDC059237 TaxID=3346784 RepID=UPI00367C511B